MSMAVRMHRRARWLLLILICSVAPPCYPADPGRTSAAPRSREELIGVWQLLSIQLVGPHGPMIDPFYNVGSTGLLIYDRSGWMSVQIVGQPRPAMEAPAARLPVAGIDKEAQRKASVLDTYYAYFGTWDFDVSASVVTHHIKSSLIPGETGISYAQTATLEGGHLIFKGRQETAEGAIVRTKVWERLSGPIR